MMKPFSHAQWRIIHDYLGSPLRRLGQLQKRLDRVGRADEQYMCALRDAYNAVHKLSVFTHYNSCESGVCAREEKPAKKSD